MDQTSFTQTIGTDRLQKAIERNKRKQELRGLRSSATSFSQDTGSTRARPMGDTIEVGTTSRPWSPPSSNTGNTGSPIRTASRRTAPKPMTSEVAVVSPTRKTVATGDQLEFSTSLRTTPSRAPAKPSYTSAKRKVKTHKKANDRFSNIMLKSAWAFCGFLLLRLIFSGGGILDYNERKSMLEGREHELENVKLDSQRTLAEIDLIQKDVSTQKKLVRDHLGFIARDEYLIIFQKDSSRVQESFSIEDETLSASL